MTRRRDFLAANGGRRVAMPGFVLQVRPRDDGEATIRVGFTVTKKIGNAVVRNRMKRRLRALARDLLPAKGIAGADHVLIGRQGGIERDYAALTAELAKALTRAASPDTSAHDRPREPRVHHGRGKGRGPRGGAHRSPESPKESVQEPARP
ncbi:ribonuclease P protein component [uncultured Sphingomonas sp.]|uniref:ribonuclease P protein component n=1 Tax=uncultured Sphingomonas sp. TaxID=158754 RepID=UPI0025E77642|nr:ribonuclease P protein component [uncultured Sphingomonas sp.]